MTSRAAVKEGEQLRAYIDRFLTALKPIILAATGSTLEIELARAFLRTQSCALVYATYHKQMELELEQHPVWFWVANSNERLLLSHPEMLLGTDNARIRAVVQRWVSLLSAEQKATVWQWAHGMLVIAGYDVSEAMEEYAAIGICK